MQTRWRDLTVCMTLAASDLRLSLATRQLLAFQVKVTAKLLAHENPSAAVLLLKAAAFGRCQSSLYLILTDVLCAGSRLMLLYKG